MHPAPFIETDQLATGFALGEWRVRPRSNMIVSAGFRPRTRRLEPKQMQVLLALAARPEEVLSRDDLMAMVWQGRCVTGASLSVAVHELRKCLGDATKRPRYIQTVPGQGYRLVARPMPLERPKTRVLGRAALAASVLLVLVLPLSPLSGPPETGGATSPGSSTRAAGIAIPPVLNLTGDQRWDAAAARVTEALQRDLIPIVGGARLDQLAVEGAIHAEGDKSALFIHLLDRSRGAVIWSKRQELSDSSGAEVETASLSAEILGTVRRGETNSLVSLERPVLAEFLRARHLVFNGGGRELNSAVMVLDSILKDYPDDPEILLTSAEASVRQWEMGYFNKSLLDQAETRVARAMAVDADNPAAQGLFAQVRFLKYWDTGAAEAAFTKALATAPESKAARKRFARLLMALGRHDEAVKQLTVAQTQYDDTTADYEIARTMFMAGQYTAAIEHLKLTVRKLDDPGPAYSLFAASYNALGRSDEALAWLRKLYSSTSHGQGFLVEVQAAYEQDGLPGYYELLLDRLLDAQKRGAPISPVAIAEMAAGAGRTDMAMEFLEKAIEERDPGLFTVDRRPTFQPLLKTFEHKAIFQRIAAALPT